MDPIKYEGKGLQLHDPSQHKHISRSFILLISYITLMLAENKCILAISFPL